MVRDRQNISRFPRDWHWWKELSRRWSFTVKRIWALSGFVQVRSRLTSDGLLDSRLKTFFFLMRRLKNGSLMPTEPKRGRCPVVPGEPGEALSASVEAREMSLLGVCANCRGKCCVGRTLVLASEAAGIVGRTGRDEFVRWNDDFLYLDRDRCPYLTSEGLCSVQEIKPFVCKIF